MEARILENIELHEQLIKRNAGRNDPMRHNNTTLLYFAVLLGLREIELTEITNELLVAPNGALNEFVVLPDSITWDGHERPLVLSNPTVKNAFEKHVKFQQESGLNTHPHSSYLGLNPAAKVFYNKDFKPFTIQSRGNGRSANMMNKYLDLLIKNAGLWNAGIRRKSFIYTFVCYAYRAKMSVNDIMCLSGLSEESVANHLIRDYTAYSPVAEWFDTRREAKRKRLESFKKRRRFMI